MDLPALQRLALRVLIAFATLHVVLIPALGLTIGYRAVGRTTAFAAVLAGALSGGRGRTRSGSASI